MISNIPRRLGGILLIIISVIFVIPWKYSAFVWGVVMDAFCQNVIDFRNNRRYGEYKKRCVYNVGYDVNDKNYQASHSEILDVYLPGRQKGEKIGLHYIPKQPEKSIFDKTIRWIFGVILTLIGLLMVFI